MKICILGNSGSGKSTLAKRLGQILNIPVYHLDRELLVGNYQKLPEEKRIAKHAALIKKPSWIIDGNYSKDLEPRFQKADLVIFINTSRLIVLPRIFKRALFGGQEKDSVPARADRKSISWNFFKFVAKYSRRRKLKIIKDICGRSRAHLLIVKNQSIEQMVRDIVNFIRKNHPIIEE